MVRAKVVSKIEAPKEYTFACRWQGGLCMSGRLRRWDQTRCHEIALHHHSRWWMMTSTDGELTGRCHGSTRLSQTTCLS